MNLLGQVETDHFVVRKTSATFSFPLSIKIISLYPNKLKDLPKLGLHSTPARSFSSISKESQNYGNL